MALSINLFIGIRSIVSLLWKKLSKLKKNYIIIRKKDNYISYRNREIETKLLAFNTDLDRVNEMLNGMFGTQKTKLLFGSSVDTYWSIDREDVDADFIRMRERDGIRQITVKGKDKGTNLDRLEVDIDSTSDVSKITKLLTSAHGKPIGRIGKIYYVYWLGTYDTVCCYTVDTVGGTYPHTIIEIECTNTSRMLSLETKVLEEAKRLDIHMERAPGSLYEMFLSTSVEKH